MSNAAISTAHLIEDRGLPDLPRLTGAGYPARVVGGVWLCRT